MQFVLGALVGSIIASCAWFVFMKDLKGKSYQKGYDDAVKEDKKEEEVK